MPVIQCSPSGSIPTRLRVPVTVIIHHFLWRICAPNGSFFIHMQMCHLQPHAVILTCTVYPAELLEPVRNTAAWILKPGKLITALSSTHTAHNSSDTSVFFCHRRDLNVTLHFLVSENWKRKNFTTVASLKLFSAVIHVSMKHMIAFIATQGLTVAFYDFLHLCHQHEHQQIMNFLYVHIFFMWNQDIETWIEERADLGFLFS